jgi:hypothetical protein
MPQLNLESLDDPLGYASCADFRGGVDNWNAPQLLAPNQFADGGNMDLQTNGILRTRYGFNSLSGAAVAAAKIQKLLYYDTPVLEQLLAAVNSSVYSWDGSAWTLRAGYSPTPGTAVGAAQGVDKVYLCDGVGHLFSYNGSAFVDLGTGSPAPPIGNIIVWHTSRVFMAGVATATDTIYVSDLLNPANWNYLTQSLRVGGGEGQAIVTLVSWDNYNLVVLKESSSYVVTTDPTQSVAAWVIAPVHKNVGCIAARTAVQVGLDVWWLAREGVVSVNRLQQETQREITTAISDPIRGYMDRINWSMASKASAILYNNHYILSVPLDGATEPNCVLIYNTITQCWSGIWLNVGAQAFAMTNFGGSQRLVFGDASGFVKQYQDFSGASTDDGVDLGSQIDLRGFNFGDARSPKAGCEVEFEFYQSSSHVDVLTRLDEGLWITTATNQDSSSGLLTLALHLPFKLKPSGIRRFNVDLMQFDPFRTIQFRLTSKAGIISLRSVTASAWGNSIELEQP